MFLYTLLALLHVGKNGAMMAIQVVFYGSYKKPGVHDIKSSRSCDIQYWDQHCCCLNIFFLRLKPFGTYRQPSSTFDVRCQSCRISAKTLMNIYSHGIRCVPVDIWQSLDVIGQGHGLRGLGAGEQAHHDQHEEQGIHDAAVKSMKVSSSSKKAHSLLLLSNLLSHTMGTTNWATTGSGRVRRQCFLGLNWGSSWATPKGLPRAAQRPRQGGERIDRSKCLFVVMFWGFDEVGSLCYGDSCYSTHPEL